MSQNLNFFGKTVNGVDGIEVANNTGDTLIYVNTADANAVAGDIVSGKTAYVNGTKITGSLTGGNITLQKNAEGDIILPTELVGDVSIKTELNVTENGVYTPSEGESYSQVTVDINSGGFEILYDSSINTDDLIPIENFYNCLENSEQNLLYGIVETPDEKTYVVPICWTGEDDELWCFDSYEDFVINIDAPTRKMYTGYVYLDFSIVTNENNEECIDCSTCWRSFDLDPYSDQNDPRLSYRNEDINIKIAKITM